jgi:hypothetical protein
MIRHIPLTFREGSMRITRLSKSSGGPPIEQFFRGFFYADFLGHQDSLREAVGEYLQSAGQDDPGGEILLSQLDDLAAQGLDEKELTEHIEQWKPNVSLHLLGLTYGSILTEIRNILRGNA